MTPRYDQARAHELVKAWDDSNSSDYADLEGTIANAFAAVRQAERERCMQVAENMISFCENNEKKRLCASIIDAIRALPPGGGA